MAKTGDGTKYLLLGNGFSIALRPDIFTYGSLYENADFANAPHIPDVFAALQTRDFEIVIRNLLDTARIARIYEPGATDLPEHLEYDASVVKDALVEAIAKRHPNRPYDIEPRQYAACRSFLTPFKHIFTLNYDVLLYWTLMQSEVDELNLRPDDGFRHPEEDPDLPYVSWQQANSPTIHFLHGALHLFDAGSQIIKYTWSKTEIPIVEQIRSALDEAKYPLFVAEGTTTEKKAKIIHNAYLHKCLRSFEGCCEAVRSTLVVYGHSLADNDAHVLSAIEKGRIGTLLLSIYGDPETAANKSIIERAHALAATRSDRYPLEVLLFDAASAKVWG